MLSKNQEISLEQTSNSVREYYEQNRNKVHCNEYIDISIKSASVLNDCIGRLQQNNGNERISELQSVYSIASKDTLDSIKREIDKTSKVVELLETLRFKTLSKKEILNLESRDYEKEVRFTKLIVDAQYDIEKSKIEYMKKEEEIPKKLYFNDTNMKAMSDLQKDINIEFIKGMKEIYLDTACKYLGTDNKPKAVLQNPNVQLGGNNVLFGNNLEDKTFDVDIEIDI